MFSPAMRRLTRATELADERKRRALRARTAAEGEGTMTVPRPAVVDQADLEWEGGEDANLATGKGIRWKLLIAGERTETAGLATGIAEVAPGASSCATTTSPLRSITS